MNPVLNHVVTAYNQVAAHATSISIDRAGVVLPAGGHFQGIQRMLGEPGEPRESREPQLLVITSSSNQQAYFVACAMAEDGLSGRAYSPVTMAMSPLRHAGGCQAVGNYLVAGIEDNDTNRVSEVQFWDFTRFPTQLIPMTIPRSGKEKVSTAGAVGLSSFNNGSALAVATYNAGTVDFYRSDADPFNGSPFTLRFTWVEDQADKTNWIDQNFLTYQNVNLVTQADGQLFMIGFERSGGDDFMDLFSVNLEGEPNSALKKLATKHMFCTDGCTFHYGGGIFIPSPDGFEVYAVNGDSGNYETGTTIHANLFAAM
jgi:hypothetical protein